jgi:hypothetical protein
MNTHATRLFLIFKGMFVCFVSSASARDPAHAGKISVKMNLAIEVIVLVSLVKCVPFANFGSVHQFLNGVGECRRDLCKRCASDAVV